MDPSLKQDIQKLRHLLTQLPASLPFASSEGSIYDFENFAPSPEWAADIGEEGAVNRQLEVLLGSRAKGPIQFVERGPGVIALADVFEKYLAKYPSSLILAKWVTDLTSATMPVSIVS
jgi:hypothetical protein